MILRVFSINKNMLIFGTKCTCGAPVAPPGICFFVKNGKFVPKVVQHTKAFTMYRQFPGLITKMKQKLQNNWSHDPRVVCVVSPQKPPYFTIPLCLLFQLHLSIIIILNVTSGCNAISSHDSSSQSDSPLL